MNRIKNYLLKHLLTAITVKDIITQGKDGTLFLDGKVIDADKIRQWQAEIKAIEGSDIWLCVKSSLKFQAEDKIFNKSLKFDDVMYGKSMLYNLSLIESIFTVIKTRQIK